MENLLPFLIIGGVIVLVIVLIYWNWLQEKKRREALQALAGELGFEFFPQGDRDLQASLSSFHLLQQGHSKRLYNLMRGSANDLEVQIFDYTYVTGGGKNSHTWHQTVICFELPQDCLPHFSLRPESVWHKIGSWFGYQDINFESHPTFSNKYLLRGSDEDAIRTLFTDDVLEWFEETNNLSGEGSGDQLLVYRQAHRPSPAATRKQMETG